MRILIAGGTGMLGSALAPYLRQVGYEVLVHGSSTHGDVQCDLTNRESVFALLKSTKPDCVVNLVALTNVDQCEQEPHAAYMLNVRTVENLAAALQEGDSAHLVHISTDQVYDSPGPHREEDVYLKNIYALTKYAGEIAASLVGATILRTNFFGPSSLDGRVSFSDWLLRSLKDGTFFTAFTDVIFSPLSMKTLGEMIATTISQPTAGVFNLGSSTALSKADFAIEIANLFKFDASNMQYGEVDARGLRAYRPKDMSMDCSRFEQTYHVKLPSLQREIYTLKKDIK